MSMIDQRPSCVACGKRLNMVRMPFTIGKKTGYIVRFVCECGHKTNCMTEEQLEQTRKLPEEM